MTERRRRCVVAFVVSAWRIAVVALVALVAPVAAAVTRGSPDDVGITRRRSFSYRLLLAIRYHRQAASLG